MLVNRYILIKNLLSQNPKKNQIKRKKVIYKSFYGISTLNYVENNENLLKYLLPFIIAVIDLLVLKSYI